MAVSTIQGGYETQNVATGIVATRKNGIVTVTFNSVTITNTSTRTNFGTLPEGWRPQAGCFAVNINGSAGYGDVTQNGAVQAFRPTAGNVDCYVTYIATA